MRVCFTSDLHGDHSLYGQLGYLLRTEQPTLLILGGDLFRDVARDAPVEPQIAAMADEFVRHIDTWHAALPQLIVAVVFGNHELACMADALQPHHDVGRLVLLEHHRPWEHNGVTFVGYPATPPSPHWAKDFERRDVAGDPLTDFGGVAWDPRERALRPIDLRDHFERRATLADDLGETPPLGNPWVLVAHAPPHDTQLDWLNGVSYPIGSRAVRAFIEERQPLLALHGHVHDSPAVTGQFAERLSDTLCVNPGQTHDCLHAVLFDLDRPATTLHHTVYP